MDIRAILLMILGWAYMKKFSNKIYFGSTDSTTWEIYFERKSKSILFLGKKNNSREKRLFLYAIKLFE